MDGRIRIRRRRIGGAVAIVGRWIAGCADAGDQAVEPDDLDTFTRWPKRITEVDALAYARLLAVRAHRRGLAIAQKNAPDLGGRGRSIAGFDFAIASGVPGLSGMRSLHRRVRQARRRDRVHGYASERFHHRLPAARRPGLRAAAGPRRGADLAKGISVTMVSATIMRCAYSGRSSARISSTVMGSGRNANSTLFFSYDEE